MSKKDIVLERLYRICEEVGDFEFHNDLVKKVSLEVGFGNPFDATKLDSVHALPPLLVQKNVALIHLGGGKHKFIEGIDKIYHKFEPIDNLKTWKYRKSILNQYNSSESNILSVANNQRILHDFLFDKDTEFDDVDVSKRPKTYFPHRTKTSFEYFLNDIKVLLNNIQIEIDLTIEYDGTVGVLEAKNGSPDSFSIYQLYHPYLYYYNANKSKEIMGRIKNILAVYVVRERHPDGDILNLWAYTFDNPLDMTTIRLVKSAKYQLITLA